MEYNYTGLIAIFVYLAILLLISKFRKKEETAEAVEEAAPIERKTSAPLDLNDEDATIASLIAAIECRNEFHRNVQVVSVRRIG